MAGRVMTASCRLERRGEAFGSAALVPGSLAALEALEARCPDHVEAGRWHQAVDDGYRFLAQWGELAEALGWTVPDLLGLHEPPERPSPLYRRLSRLDTTGLI